MFNKLLFQFTCSLTTLGVRRKVRRYNGNLLWYLINNMQILGYFIHNYKLKVTEILVGTLLTEKVVHQSRV